jgi:hypothetical protein
MAPMWTDVKRLFDGLSYVLKGQSPDGTELYFTVAYDTWRRRDPKDLCESLDKKRIAGTTKISYRLNLLLEDIRARRPKLLAGGKKKEVLRNISIYVLTNGEWGEGPDPKITIKKTADSLVAGGMSNEQLTIQFISFAQTAVGAARVADLGNTDFGL